MIECRTMTGPERYDAYALLRRFRTDEGRLGEALTLFVDRPDYGFLWLAYDDDLPAACVSVAQGIDTAAGGVVATLRDFFVVPERRRRGIGTALLLTLHGRLDHLAVKRLDALAGDDPGLAAFLGARGYLRQGTVFTHHR